MLVHFLGARLCEPQHARTPKRYGLGFVANLAKSLRVTGPRSNNSRDANTGVGQDFTGLVAAVQLRLRVASGLQALQRCSGLLNRRARGSTVATRHFTPAWLSSD